MFATTKQGAWSQAITAFKQADAQQPRAERVLREPWAERNVAAVTIEVTPADAKPEIVATGFLPDEKLGRGTIV